MNKILITGASGFAGGYLAEYLLSQNHNVELFGTYFNDESLEKSPVKEKIQFKKIDLKNTDEVYALIKELKPVSIYHLAAAASTGQSIKDPISTMHSNIDTQVNLLESVRKLNLMETTILIVSSALVYGYIKKGDLPINENTPFRPSNPYAVSKIAQDYLALQYWLSYNLPIIRVRPFNHIGPRQSLGFVVSDFAKQIADIEKEIQKPVVKVGNLKVMRDFTDVRDVVKAYALIMEKGKYGEVYNIGNGESVSIKNILDTLLSLSERKIEVISDSEKMRENDISNIVCDHSKLTEVTGWQPQISLKETLSDILDYWRMVN